MILVLAYRNKNLRLLFLDVVTDHLFISYTNKEVSQFKLEKQAGLNETIFKENKLFNLSYAESKINGSTFFEGFLTTDFYTKYTTKKKITEPVSNFQQLDGINIRPDLFWKILITNQIRLNYKRKPTLYNQWDQWLGPLTSSKYDKIHFERECLKSELNFVSF